MQFFKTLLFALPVLSLAVPAPVAEPARLTKREDRSADIIAGIEGLMTAATKLNTTLNGFKPRSFDGIQKALQIQQQTNALGDRVVALTKIGEESDNFSSDNSGKIAQAFVKFSPVIQGVLDNLISRKPAFATALLFLGDISKTVEAALKKMKEQTSESFEVITPKLAPPFSGAAGLVTGPILNKIDEAIQAFASCSGILCLPDVGGLFGGGK